jgi:hypothetical protein
MTFCQLASVVVGQETGLLNCVSFEKDVRKVVLLTHSTPENLTRDWPNTAALHGDVPCCAGMPRLHYDWQFCKQDPTTKAAACQARSAIEDVLREIEPRSRRWRSPHRFAGQRYDQSAPASHSGLFCAHSKEKS